MAKLVLETGIKSYEIYNEHDDFLGTINIHPTDLGFATRAQEAKGNILNHIDEAQKIATESEMNEEEMLKQIKEIDQKIKGELDFMFGENVSETVFKHLNCLSVSPNSGKYYVENFIDMIIPVIEKSHQESIKKAESRMNDYVGHASKRK